MFFLKKKTEEISRISPGYEEAGERKTPKTGIILLILMFVAGLYFGWGALDDLSRVPSSPEALSFCANRYLTSESDYQTTPIKSPILEPAYENYNYNYYANDYYNNSSKCQFNDLERKYNIPVLINAKRRPLEEELTNVGNQINTVNRSLQDARVKRQDLENQYGIGLQEKGAGVPRQIFPITPEVQNQILKLREEETRLQDLHALYQSSLTTKQNELKKIDEELKTEYKPVFEEQNKRLRIYELKIFLLQFLLVLPLFLLILWVYLRSMRRNSPYSIIFTAILAVLGVLVLRTILFWFWGLFLARIIEILWRWIQQFQLIRSLVFYLGMIISFVIFGGAVYYLQRKIFDPRRVAIRRFRAKQCPYCQTNLDLASEHCPNCGKRLKEECSVCHNMRFIDLPFCQHCGNKK